MSSLRERFAQSPSPMTVGAGDNNPRAPAAPKIELNFDDLGSKLSMARDTSLESVPRDTVLKLLTEAKLDEMFVFHVAPGEGGNHVQAMRQVLSRARDKARKKKTQLDEFKLLCHEIKCEPGFDKVTLIRTKQMSAHEESVYDALIDAFKKDQ